MGLDPPTLMTLSPLLHRLAKANAPRLVLALRPQDPLPKWITHLVYLDKECKVAHQGRKDELLVELKGKIGLVGELPGADMRGQVVTSKPKAKLAPSSESPDAGQMKSSKMTEESREKWQKLETERSGREVLVNMEGVCVKYGEKIVLGNWTQGSEGEKTRGLRWDVRRGDRWGIFGPNGL